MKKLFLALFLISCVVCGASCEKDNSTKNVTINVKPCMPAIVQGPMKSYSMYNEFHSKYIQSFELVPKYYELVLTNTSNGNSYKITRKWGEPSPMTVEIGTYRVTGKSHPKNWYFNTSSYGNREFYNDSVSLKFNTLVNITSNGNVDIVSEYDSYLILTDTNQVSNVLIKYYLPINSTTGEDKYITALKHGKFIPIFSRVSGAAYMYGYTNKIILKKQDVDVLEIPSSNKFTFGCFYYVKNNGFNLEIPEMNEK